MYSKITFRNRVVFLFTLLVAGVSSNAQDLPGTWQGRLSFMGSDIRIIFHFTRDQNKSFSATMESPDQSRDTLEVDEIEVNGDSLSMQMYKLHGEYSGVYSKDSLAYIGTLKQGAFKIPLKLVKGEADDLLYKRPQKPIRPFPYSEEEVVVINNKANLELSGTFTKPKGKGKFPAVILITGSGRQDRDESIMAHKPFLLISDYLTRKGFAVLRCDDRGTGRSTGDFASSTTADFATDVEAEINYLKTRSDVDKEKLGLLGHSEGGTIAPMVAAANADIAFVVLLAAPAINMFDLLLIQDSLTTTAEGMSPEKVHRFVYKNKKLFGILRNVRDSAAAADSIDNYLTNQGTNVETIVLTLKQLNSRWMRWYIDFDPEVNLRKLHCAVLAINGEKDVQVPAEIDIRTIDETLKSIGNKNYKTVILPGLNHLFQKCIKCSVNEYASIEETIDPLALTTIGDWMELNFLKKK